MGRDKLFELQGIITLFPEKYLVFGFSYVSGKVVFRKENFVIVRVRTKGIVDESILER